MDSDNSTLTVTDNTTTEEKPKGFGRGKAKNGMPVVWYKIFRKYGKTDTDALSHWDAGYRTLPDEFKSEKKVYVRKTAVLSGAEVRIAIPDEDKGDYFREYTVGGEVFKIGSNKHCFSLSNGSFSKFYSDFSGVLGEMRRVLTKKNLKKVNTLDDLLNLETAAAEEIKKFSDLLPKDMTQTRKEKRANEQSAEATA